MDNSIASPVCYQGAFIKEIDGKQTGLYVLANKVGSEMTVTNYGAKIVSLMVPDKNGTLIDVVLGHSSIDEYLNSEEPYFGAVCGRIANRLPTENSCWKVKNTLTINNGPIRFMVA